MFTPPVRARSRRLVRVEVTLSTREKALLDAISELDDATIPSEIRVLVARRAAELGVTNAVAP